MPHRPVEISIGGRRLLYPTPGSAAVTAVMRGNRSRDTKPEVRLRSALHQRGHRFRKDYRVPMAGRVARLDIAFTARRVAVFVDGCFWHGCPEHGRAPKSNAEYWTAKLARNAERDVQTDRELTLAGWTVVRVWEHDVVAAAVRAVEDGLTRVRDETMC